MQLLSLDDVLLKLRLSKPMVYKLIRTAEFPRPLKIGTRSVWREDEVDAWILRQRVSA